MYWRSHPEPATLIPGAGKPKCSTNTQTVEGVFSGTSGTVELSVTTGTDYKVETTTTNKSLDIAPFSPSFSCHHQQSRPPSVSALLTAPDFPSPRWQKSAEAQQSVLRSQIATAKRTRVVYDVYATNILMTFQHFGDFDPSSHDENCGESRRWKDLQGRCTSSTTRTPYPHETDHVL